MRLVWRGIASAYPVLFAVRRSYSAFSAAFRSSRTRRSSRVCCWRCCLTRCERRSSLWTRCSVATLLTPPWDSSTLRRTSVVCMVCVIDNAPVFPPLLGPLSYFQCVVDTGSDSCLCPSAWPPSLKSRGVFRLRRDVCRVRSRLTCSETDAEAPVVKTETHRKLVCTVDGGPGRPVQVNHLSAGIEVVSDH